MLLVKARLAKSPIEGLGLFAHEFIAKHTVVWRFNPVLDQLLKPDVLETLSEHDRAYLHRYTYLNMRTGNYVLCGDDSRFINHSEDPNLVGVYPPGDDEGEDVAARDIQKGEELTSDYRTFDRECRLKLGEVVEALETRLDFGVHRRRVKVS